MKPRTPIKYSQQSKNKRQSLKIPFASSKHKYPLTSSIHSAEDFNPSVYITAKFNEQDIMDIKEAFDYYDSNGTGILTPNDLKQALFHQNFHATKETVYNIIAEYDEECLGGLNFEAFVKIIQNEPQDTQSLTDLKKMFRKIDHENKGHLNQKDLENLLKSLGQNEVKESVSFMMSKIDKNQTGKITFEDFCKVMHSTKSIY